MVGFVIRVFDPDVLFLLYQLPSGPGREIRACNYIPLVFHQTIILMEGCNKESNCRQYQFG